MHCTSHSWVYFTYPEQQSPCQSAQNGVRLTLSLQPCTTPEAVLLKAPCTAKIEFNSGNTALSSQCTCLLNRQRNPVSQVSIKQCRCITMTSRYKHNAQYIPSIR